MPTEARLTVGSSRAVAADGSTRCADAGVFLELAIPHLSTIRGLVQSIVHSEADAEEVLQETLLLALCNRHKLQNLDSLRSWLAQIAINSARKNLRQNSWAPLRPATCRASDELERLLRETPDRRDNPAEMLQRREVQALIRQKFANLPARERRVLALCDLQDISANDAAGRLGLSKARVRTTLHRARTRLRRDLSFLTEA